MTLIRSGLRIHKNEVESDIADAFKLFAKWLRVNYDFPIRLPVYLSTKDKVTGRDGEKHISIFFAPYDNGVEPYLSIATGDYLSLVEEDGKQNALFSLLHSLAIGVVKYQKWLSDNKNFDSYVSENDSEALLYKYIEALEEE